MPRTLLPLAFASLLFVAAPPLLAQASQAVYKWTDDKGVVHYTDSPPPGKTFEQRSIAPPKQATPVEPPPEAIAEADAPSTGTTAGEETPYVPSDESDADNRISDAGDGDDSGDREDRAGEDGDEIAEAPAPAPAPPTGAAKPPTQDQINCENSRKNVELLKSRTPVVQDIDGDGKPDTLNATQRAAELARAESMVKLFCKP